MKHGETQRRRCETLITTVKRARALNWPEPAGGPWHSGCYPIRVSMYLAPLVGGALIAAHVMGRAVLPVIMRSLPLARADGLAHGAGKPTSAGMYQALGLVQFPRMDERLRKLKSSSRQAWLKL